MIYDTFYAKLVPNGAVTGTKYSVSISGVTAIVGSQKTYTGADMYFAITPKSSGNAIVTFKNDTTGDIIGTRNILVRSTTRAKPTYKLTASATTVNEGGTVTFTLDTSDILPNTNIGYRISGVSVEDISLSSLTGNFKIGSDGTSTLAITLLEDLITEGDEILRLELTTDNTIFKEVTIKDTSVNAAYSGSATFKAGTYSTAPGVYQRGFIYYPSTSIIVGEEINDTIKFNNQLVDLTSCHILDVPASTSVSLFVDIGKENIIPGDMSFVVKLTNLTNNKTYTSPILEVFFVDDRWKTGWAIAVNDPAIASLLREIMADNTNVKVEFTYS